MRKGIEGRRTATGTGLLRPGVSVDVVLVLAYTGITLTLSINSLAQLPILSSWRVMVSCWKG